MQRLARGRCPERRLQAGVQNRPPGFWEPRRRREAPPRPRELRLGASALAESHPAQESPVVPVEVVQAVHFILVVQGEALVTNAACTGDAGEAGGVEGLVQGPDDVFPDHLATLATLLQGVLGQRDIASEPPHGGARSEPKGVSGWLPTAAQKGGGTGEGLHPYLLPPHLYR